ncbi:MAG: helix-turn-helix domain-containing protein [Deltaproteobacteria bacterium]|nr:helix-turn-helix domain-containing protein [Deltaproteobacteria bacterium]
MEEQVKFLKETEVSHLTGLALSTLRNNRHQGKGLPYFKIGSSIRYSLQDIIEYMDQRKIQTEN